MSIDPAPPWLIAQTNINCELRAMRGLRDRRFEVWMPEVVREITIGRGASKTKACRKFPAVAGLLLVRHRDWWAWPEIRTVDGIRAIVSVGAEPAQVSAAAVSAWREHLKPLPMPVIDQAFRIGQDVRITDGPLLGFSGAVERLLGKSGAQVALMVFGQPTRLQIDRAKLEAVA